MNFRNVILFRKIDRAFFAQKRFVFAIDGLESDPAKQQVLDEAQQEFFRTIDNIPKNLENLTVDSAMQIAKSRIDTIGKMSEGFLGADKKGASYDRAYLQEIRDMRRMAKSRIDDNRTDYLNTKKFLNMKTVVEVKLYGNKIKFGGTLKGDSNLNDLGELIKIRGDLELSKSKIADLDFSDEAVNAERKDLAGRIDEQINFFSQKIGETQSFVVDSCDKARVLSTSTQEKLEDANYVPTGDEIHALQDWQDIMNQFEGVLKKFPGMEELLPQIETSVVWLQTARKACKDRVLGIKPDQVDTDVSDQTETVKNETYYSSKKNEIDEDLKVAIEGYDQLHLPEKTLETAENVRQNNLYFAGLNAAHANLLAARDEYNNLRKDVTADGSIDKETKEALTAEIKAQLESISNALSDINAKLKVFVQDKDSVSADYLRDKQNAEQQVLEDLMRASLAKQVNLNKALTAVMRKNPGMSRKEALKKVDGKLVRDASDALSSFREQQEHYRILAGFKGNMSVIPGGKIPVSPEFYAAIEAQFDPKTKKEIYATDPDLLGIQQGTPEYNRAKNSFIDEWYGQAALQSQGKAYPRPDVQA